MKIECLKKTRKKTVAIDDRQREYNLYIIRPLKQKTKPTEQNIKFKKTFLK